MWVCVCVCVGVRVGGRVRMWGGVCVCVCVRVCGGGCASLHILPHTTVLANQRAAFDCRKGYINRRFPDMSLILKS